MHQPPTDSSCFIDPSLHSDPYLGASNHPPILFYTHRTSIAPTFISSHNREEIRWNFTVWVFRAFFHNSSHSFGGVSFLFASFVQIMESPPSLYPFLLNERAISSFLNTHILLRVSCFSHLQRYLSSRSILFRFFFGGEFDGLIRMDSKLSFDVDFLLPLPNLLSSRSKSYPRGNHPHRLESMDYHDVWTDKWINTIRNGFLSTCYVGRAVWGWGWSY